MTRAPLTIMAVLAALLMGLWFLTEGSAEEPAPEPVAPVDEIARRVEALRGLKFDTLPEPVQVTPAQAEREGLEDLDRSYPTARRRADEQVLKLLGLIDPSVDLREVSGSLFSEGVLGYYDPRTKRLRVVKGAATGGRVLAEMTLAHELTHALEDQRFGLDLEGEGCGDDAALARLALVEGTASELMYAYADRHFTAEETLGGVLGSAFQPLGLAARLPAGAARVPLRRRPGVRVRAARAGRRALDARGPGRPLARAAVDRAGAAPGEVGARRAAGAGARARRRGARAGLEARRGRRAGGVPDARAARRRGRRRVRRRGGGLGRGPLRAVAPRLRATAAPRPAAATRRWSRAGAGTRRPTSASSRPSCASGCATGSAPVRTAERMRGVAVAVRDGAVTLAMAPTGPLARRLADAPSS